jgi:hypothetical protein
MFDKSSGWEFALPKTPYRNKPYQIAYHYHSEMLVAFVFDEPSFPLWPNLHVEAGVEFLRKSLEKGKWNYQPVKAALVVHAAYDLKSGGKAKPYKVINSYTLDQVLAGALAKAGGE